MITRDKLPSDFRHCIVCGRAVTNHNRHVCLLYDDQGAKHLKDCCRPCATRLRRDGITTLWHHETPFVVGPDCPRNPD